MVLKQSLIHAYEKYQKTVFLFTSFKKVDQILTKPSSYNHRQSIEKNCYSCSVSAQAFANSKYQLYFNIDEVKSVKICLPVEIFHQQYLNLNTIPVKCISNTKN